MEQLFEKNNFYDFAGEKVSVVEIFEKYPELMEEYDIQEANELHNLMRKNADKLLSYHVVMKRMPFIEVKS